MTSPSKRDLERKLDDRESRDKGELPVATIADILSSANAGEHDPLPDQPGIIRCFGDLYQTPDLPPGFHAGTEGDE